MGEALRIRRPPSGGAKRVRPVSHFFNHHLLSLAYISSLLRNPLPHWPTHCRRPLPKWLPFCSEKSSEIQTLKKMPFGPKMEPFWEPMGTHKSKKSAKVPPKGALFTPSEKRHKNHRSLDPPEPSELSWRLHKTSIFTCWPCPQNNIETTSQNLPFGTFGLPHRPK